MTSHTRTLEDRLLQRECVVCGYDGALLRSGRASRCARCGCDLRRRPARSYAEMEGFIGGASTQAASSTPAQQRLLQRWLAVLFLLLLGLSAIVFLATRAVSG